VKGLTDIEIHYGTPLTAYFFVGAFPRTVSVHGAPDSEQEAFSTGSLLNSAKEISFELDEVSNESTPLLLTLGAFMAGVTSLDIDCGHLLMNDVMCSWLPHMKNLTRLDITWNQESAVVLDAAASCPALEFLQLKNDSFNVLLKLSDIAASLKGLKALQKLVLPERLYDMTGARIMCTTGQVHEFQIELEKIVALLPERLQSLHDVYVRSHLKNVFDVHIFGFFYCITNFKVVCDLLIQKIKEVGADKVCHEYCDTPLTYLLAGSPDMSATSETQESITMEQKVEALLDAGADPLRTAAVPGISGKICWGNVFHAASMYANSDDIIEFISAIEKRDLNASAASMKTSEGFTPLHFAGMNSDSWIALSDYLKQHVSEDLLTDSENVLRISPLTAIHRRIDPDLVSPLAVAECANFMLENEPWKANQTVQQELGQLFPVALDFYASYLGTQPASDSEEGDIDEDEEEKFYPFAEVSPLLETFHSTHSGTRLTVAGSALPVAAKRLCAAFILCSTEVQQAVIRESLEVELSAAVVAICSMEEAKIDMLSSAISSLLKAGAQPGFTHSDICSGFTALGAFVAVHTPLEEDIVEEYHWLTDCQTFWKLFWQLADAGVLPSGGEERSIFASDHFGLLLRREDQSAEVEHLREWFNKIGASEELEQLESILAAPHSGSDDDADGADEEEEDNDEDE
jgi:hypothetical protein